MRPVASTPNVPPRPAASNPTLPQLPVAVVSELVALSEGPVPPAPATGNLPSRPRRPLPRPPPKLVPSTGSTSTAFLALPTLVLAPAASAPRAPFPESPMPDLTSPKASRSSYTPWANWTDGFYLRQTIIDHTNKRVQATFDVPWDEMQVGADGLSPWISASRDPGWAVWEVARRLAQVPGESVHIAVIAMQPKALLTPARGAAGEVVLDPYATLLDCKRKNIGTATQGRMTNNAKEAVERSLFGVNASSEVLFYGRIFADSIVSVMEFTHDHLPLGLPPHWLAQPGKTWMDSLVWDPYEQAYDWHNARQRIATVAAGGELPSLGKLTTRTSYAPHPSVTRRGTISSVNISIHTGQNGDLEDIAPGAHTVPTDAKVHSTYSRPAEPKTILNPAPPKMPRAARQRPRDTPPRHQRQPPSKPYGVTDQTQRMSHGISDNGW
ncbi:uncharacterized protein CcaverHIS019_0509040 [Cutaneotrichosporon cavernicola]|uniref:Uncharacterized protein n=1 Tax=Cutaneotrichosporon cavernicola TaxID=279322 RepID=A0AA48L734_9TREE|nr:uncharacterized protein CcaverHIS019_0509040 [Cutaneotrichosporon cavernicola]BEI93276.1 hypothetical protein CcaverHIS019_0509040 [Cutaneotrichosporon cavernicola]